MKNRLAAIFLAFNAFWFIPLAAPAQTIAPSFSAQPMTVLDTAGTVQLVVRKSAKAKSYSRVRVHLLASTCVGIGGGMVDVTLHFANNTLTQSVAVPIPQVQGNCDLTLKLTAVRYATIATPTVNITVQDAAPAPEPTQKCPDGTIIPISMTCPAPPPIDPQPVGPDQFGRYLCPGSTDIYALDPANCPVIPEGGIAAYGSYVVATQPCVGSYIQTALVVGQRYLVVGNHKGVRAEPGKDPTVPSGYALNPATDNGLNRGDGHFGIWVPYSCARRELATTALRAATPTGIPQPPLAKLKAAPIKVATQDCRNIFDENILRVTGVEPTKFSMVHKGKRYRVEPVPNRPGAVFAKPVTLGEGVSEVREACFQ